MRKVWVGVKHAFVIVGVVVVGLLLAIIFHKDHGGGGH